ncbi:hypothetical protein ZWY2020_034591 [Hordeum vulgare]|nr:hypothetical protein ZWY2020_034591 [Hordeum vulgare]
MPPAPGIASVRGHEGHCLRPRLLERHLAPCLCGRLPELRPPSPADAATVLLPAVGRRGLTVLLEVKGVLADVYRFGYRQAFNVEYLKIEAEARSLAAKFEVENDWKDIKFREANMEDRKMIEELLQDEESIPTRSFWAVKLGTNLYYSANLAKSPLHNKQMPYNRVIYKAFDCSSPNSPRN